MQPKPWSSKRMDKIGTMGAVSQDGIGRRSCSMSNCPRVLRKRAAIIRFCCDTICVRSCLKYRMFNGLSVVSESLPPKTSVKHLTYSFEMSSFPYVDNDADAYMMFLSQHWDMYPEGPEGYPSVDVIGKSGKWCANPKTEVENLQTPQTATSPTSVRTTWVTQVFRVHLNWSTNSYLRHS